MEKKCRTHLPEVGDCVSQRPLCGDVRWLPGVMVKLEKKGERATWIICFDKNADGQNNLLHISGIVKCLVVSYNEAGIDVVLFTGNYVRFQLHPRVIIWEKNNESEMTDSLISVRKWLKNIQVASNKKSGKKNKDICVKDCSHVQM